MTRPTDRPIDLASRLLTLATVGLFSLVTGCASDPGSSPTDAASGVDVPGGQADVMVASDTGPNSSGGAGGGNAGSGGVNGGSGGVSGDALIADVAMPRPDVGRGDAGPVIPGNPQELIGKLIADIDQTVVEQAVTELYQMSIPNRATGTANYKKATEWARAMVEAKAPATMVTFIEGNGLRNTEIVLPGSDPNAGMYIVGGHMDSVTAGPGADDDGSGAIGTMFVAMALAKYQFKSEVRFILFDAEERGWVGSTVYAKALRPMCAPDTCLKLYVNLDMISNDPNNRARISVTTTDTALRALHTKINTDYALGAVLVFGGSTCGDSDDCSFQRSDYKTVEIKENDFSPNWHKRTDIQSNQNVATMTKNIKLAAGVAASLAGIEGTRP
jgi:hypothetical protein